MSKINVKKFNPKDFNKIDDIPDHVDEVLIKQVPFTQVCNEVVNHIHNGLALGVWTYLLSKPPTWVHNKYQIMKCFDIGEVSYKKIVSFLRKCKLVDYEKYRSEDGKFIKTRMIVENGCDFIRQCSEKNGCHKNCSKVDQKPTSTESVPVAKPTESLGPIHRYKKPPSGKPSVRKTPPLINIDIINKDNNKNTTTTCDSPVVDFQSTDNKTSSRSSSFIDISQLHEFGFNEGHKKQLEALNLKANLINESIGNYFQALQDSAFNAKTNNKPAYFMYVMRTFGFYDQPGKRVLTPKQKQARYLIENNVDNRYGI